jgi:sulfur-carrier protein adenylyltransferase/sulfurtransferase
MQENTHMSWRDIVNLTSEEFRVYRHKQKERHYLLLDVRQPEEYGEGHIAGATLMPLMELERRLMQLPSDRDLVFYCRSGSRSVAAAYLVAETEITEGGVYNLVGGMLEWDGGTLPDFPKIGVFGEEAEAADLLYRAMDLEKGAWRFYHHIKDAYADRPFCDVFEQLSKAEVGHARSVYRFWKDIAPAATPFETLFETLPGEVLEGGETLQTMLERVESIQGDLCLNLMEIAIRIENTAFDLYRGMAEDSTDPTAREAFFSIAQQEKAHILALAKAVGRCHE